MKILHLTIKRKWFDPIAAGVKKVEYRAVKPYWTGRLISDGTHKFFDQVHFHGGGHCGPSVPLVRVEWAGMATTYGDLCHPMNGEELDENTLYYLILLGKVLEVRRWYANR